MVGSRHLAKTLDDVFVIERRHELSLSFERIEIFCVATVFERLARAPHGRPVGQSQLALNNDAKRACSKLITNREVGAVKLDCLDVQIWRRKTGREREREGAREISTCSEEKCR